MNLLEMTCVPLADGSPALADARVHELLAEVPGWTTADATESRSRARQLRKTFQFNDFLGAMAFVDRLAALAEAEQHHPEFCVHYDRVDVTLWTHTVKGLSDNDFIFAAKLNAVFT